MKKKFIFILIVLLCICCTGCHFHEWTEATCTEPRNCIECEKTKGEPLGHDWQEATCIEAQTCNRCGIIEGNPLGHQCDTWEIVKEATCSSVGEEKGICIVCGETDTREIKKLSHTSSDNWVTTIEATDVKKGTKVKYCSVCGEVSEEENYELTEAEKKEYFKKKCKTYTYNEIARNPDKYTLEAAKFKGEVMQVIEDGNEYILLINVTKGKYTWSDRMYVGYTRNSSSEDRILEDDIVTIYGYLLGTTTYETVLGKSVTIPAMIAEYIEIN